MRWAAAVRRVICVILQLRGTARGVRAFRGGLLFFFISAKQRLLRTRCGSLRRLLGEGHLAVSGVTRQRQGQVAQEGVLKILSSCLIVLWLCKLAHGRCP